MRESRFIQLAVALLVLWLLLIFPGHPDRFNAAALWHVPLELPAMLLLLLSARGRILSTLRVLLVILTGILLLLRLADIGSYLAFDRRFSPLLEWHLLSKGWHLASTAIGPVQAVGIAAVALLLLLWLCLLLYRSLGTLAHWPLRTRSLARWVSVALLGVFGITALAQSEPGGDDPLLRAEVIPELQNRVQRVQRSVVDQAEFVRALTVDTVLDHHTPTFAALQGRDIIVLFIESYGRGYVEAEPFLPRAAKRLSISQSELERAGFSVRSGWATSPVRGGRSWLAHATFDAGLKVDNQARFDRLISSDRVSINQLFQQAGWQTIGIMPAIQFDWPEGRWYGFETLLTADQLGYQGERFGYATMPDQYTLAAFERLARAPASGPVMAQLALISTHAPWAPLPQILPWDDIGDGSVFDGSRRSGETIAWKFRSRVQQQYADTMDYTLQSVTDYITRYANDALLVVVGDHQPPPVINGWGKSADVPIHIISRDESLLDRLPATLWSDGMTPATTLPSQPMQDLRKAFSTWFEAVETATPE